MSKLAQSSAQRVNKVLGSIYQNNPVLETYFGPSAVVFDPLGQHLTSCVFAIYSTDGRTDVDWGVERASPWAHLKRLKGASVRCGDS